MFAGASGMLGQNLPATPPTAMPGQVSPDATQAAVPAPDPPRHAEVILTHGLVQIRADNSSLNQILRSISRITGMKSPAASRSSASLELTVPPRYRLF